MTSTTQGFTPVALHELVRHMEWADVSVWRAVLAHRPAEQDDRVRSLLGHLHGVQHAFLAVWTGRPVPAPTHGTPELPAILSWSRRYYQELATAVERFDDAELARPIRMPYLEPYEQQTGRRFDVPTLAETVVQVVSHSTYHRGQVNARLREIGGEPPLVDFIAWIWFGKPAPEWRSVE